MLYSEHVMEGMRRKASVNRSRTEGYYNLYPLVWKNLVYFLLICIFTSSRGSCHFLVHLSLVHCQMSGEESHFC